jgi:predicted HTH transcriptional regulator
MKIFILLVQWSVGVFLTLASIGGLLEGEFLYGFICLIVGLALLPPVANKFTGKKLADQQISAAQAEADMKRLMGIINDGENTIIEFKSTLRVDLKTGRPEKFIQHAVIKTIAAFLNTRGGVLYIGINDAKKIIGIDEDLNSFTGADKTDEFRKFLDTMLANALGNRFQRYLQVMFLELEEKTICSIIVNGPSTSPVYILSENKQEVFYIRRLASTIDLPPSEALIYIKEHWK